MMQLVKCRQNANLSSNHQINLKSKIIWQLIHVSRCLGPKWKTTKSNACVVWEPQTVSLVKAQSAWFPWRNHVFNCQARSKRKKERKTWTSKRSHDIAWQTINTNTQKLMHNWTANLFAKHGRVIELCERHVETYVLSRVCTKSQLTSHRCSILEDWTKCNLIATRNHHEPPTTLKPNQILEPLPKLATISKAKYNCSLIAQIVENKASKLQTHQCQLNLRGIDMTEGKSQNLEAPILRNILRWYFISIFKTLEQ